METLADRISQLNRSLDFSGELPEGIGIMNPFRQDNGVLELSDRFYRKFYNDNHPRNLILGINPGRFGAGLTGIPFTDPKRMKDPCGLHFEGKVTHEPSSVFVYEVISAYGGPECFYQDFYINSVFPLGFTTSTGTDSVKNYNYYDSRALTKAITPYAAENIRNQINLGMNQTCCICFGTGKNEKFLQLLNKEFMFFEEIIALEHPRFIMQYKSSQKSNYIEKYLQALKHVKTMNHIRS